MKKKAVKRGLFLAILLLVLSGIISIIIAIFDFKIINPPKRYVSLTLTLTYEGAANGLTPTGEVFTIDGIKSIDIINQALDELEMNRYYKAEDIYNNLSITGAYPNDVIERIQQWDSLYDFSSSRYVQQSAYYPTVFKISLYDGFGTDVTETSLNSLLEEIVNIYRTKLIYEYVYGFKKDAIDEIIDISDTDYRYQLDILNERLKILNSYSKELYKKNIGFKYDNRSFNDICVKCNSIVENDLAGLEALIMVNANSKSVSRLKNQYQYNINKLLDRLEQTNNNLEEIDELINSYEMDDILYVGIGDSYVKVESNSSKTYEQLIDRKLSLTEKITKINSELSKYRQYVNDLNTGKVSSQNNPQIQIDQISEKIKDIENLFEQMVYAYNDSIITADNIIVSKITYSSPKLVSGNFVIRLINWGIPVFIFAFIIFSFYKICFEIKNRK